MRKHCINLLRKWRVPCVFLEDNIDSKLDKREKWKAESPVNTWKRIWTTFPGVVRAWFDLDGDIVPEWGLPFTAQKWKQMSPRRDNPRKREAEIRANQRLWEEARVWIVRSQCNHGQLRGRGQNYPIASGPQAFSCFHITQCFT